MRMVSARVSPLATDIIEGWDISMVRPPSLAMAVSKDMRVRVEGSKNRFARMRPSSALVRFSPLA